MILEVVVGAGIMFIGMLTGWSANDVSRRKYEAIKENEVEKED